jgi:hypothetical protein
LPILNFANYSVEEISPSLSPDGVHTIDVIVENMGRVNVGPSEHMFQVEGIPSGASIELNNERITSVQHIALEMGGDWIRR